MGGELENGAYPLKRTRSQGRDRLVRGGQHPKEEEKLEKKFRREAAAVRDERSRRAILSFTLGLTQTHTEEGKTTEGERKSGKKEETSQREKARLHFPLDGEERAQFSQG